MVLVIFGLFVVLRIKRDREVEGDTATNLWHR